MLVNPTQRELVESIGVFFERLGYAPAGGRILGLLLVVESASLPFDDIVQELGLSKGAVSTALQLLIALDMVEYTTLNGGRKRFFQVKMNSWERIMQTQLAQISTLQQLITAARKSRSTERADFNAYLDGMIAFHEELHVAMSEFVSKWKTRGA